MHIAITDFVPINHISFVHVDRRSAAIELVEILKDQYLVDLALHNVIPDGWTASVDVSVIEDDPKEVHLRIQIDGDMEDLARGQLKKKVLDALSWKSVISEEFAARVQQKNPLRFTVRDWIYVDDCDLQVGHQDLIAAHFSEYLSCGYFCALEENVFCGGGRYGIDVLPGTRSEFDHAGPEIEINGSLDDGGYPEFRQHLRKVLPPVPEWWSHFANGPQPIFIREFFNLGLDQTIPEGADTLRYMREYVRVKTNEFYYNADSDTLENA